MVESLRELKKICQKSNYKEEGNWMARHIVRDAALPVTKLLLHTRVTANQVTLLSLLTGLLGIIVLARPGKAAFLIGSLFLQLWYLLDHVDGQIARYRKTASLTGRFFDFLMHHVIHGVIFFSLGYLAFLVTGDHLFVLWGFLTSLAILIFNLIHDTKYKTFFEKLAAVKAVEIRSASGQGPSSQQDRGIAKRFFSFCHKLSEMHVVMNILTLASVASLLMNNIDLRVPIFIFYGLNVPALTLVKVTYLIVHQKIDEEFQATFHIPPRN